MNNSMIRGFVIIFGFLAIGEMIVSVTGIKFPASIIGMLLLTASLKLGWVKVHWVKSISSILIGNLSFFFVAPGVAIMLYLGLIKQNFLSIIVASVYGQKNKTYMRTMQKQLIYRYIDVMISKRKV